MWTRTKIDNDIVELNLPTTKSDFKKERKEIIAILRKSMSKKEIKDYLKTR